MTKRRSAQAMSTLAVAILATTFAIPVGALAQASGGYGGPTLLSRAGDRPGRRMGAPLNFNVHGSIRGTYETGLFQGGVRPDGTIETLDVAGVSMSGDVYGAKVWRRSGIGLDYRADYRYSSAFQQWNGLLQAVSFEYYNRLSRRLTVSTRTLGGTSNRAFGSFSTPTFTRLSDVGVPTNELYDARFYYVQQNVSLYYQSSARRQYFVDVGGYFTKRTQNLPGVQGGQISGGIQHQLSLRQSVGGQYQYYRMEYPQVFTKVDGHGFYGSLSRRFSPNFTVSGSGGLMIIKLVGARAVQLSPEVAAILGRSQDVAAYRDTVYAPSVDVSAAYSLDDSRFSAGFQHGLNAGNGVLLASTTTSFGAGYAYSGLRKLSLAASTGYSEISSLSTNLGRFRRWQAGGSANYRLGESLALSTSFEVRQFDTGAVQSRSGWYASIGLSYSPAHFPIPVW